ncbi:recombinase family protein [Kribbella qitaiheensis]|uniref:Recombinase family protein n=1 Tax=Kribbella qitaiheensis TaxID=1544730 RepID=A0A7G6X097_9ACTN|nr:recombinase family protein [Kribbella qitaiheensis]QNE19662.1 recombinase family protein [Kribbella qitaiheensis]
MKLVHGDIMEIREKQKPYVAVYIRELPMMSASDFRRARDGLIRFGQSRGLKVDDIFEEKLESVPDAFTQMIAKLQAVKGNVLIIPGVHHLTGLGNHPMEVLAAFHSYGIEILIAGHVE